MMITYWISSDCSVGLRVAVGGLGVGAVGVAEAIGVGTGVSVAVGRMGAVGDGKGVGLEARVAMMTRVAVAVGSRVKVGSGKARRVGVERTAIGSGSASEGLIVKRWPNSRRVNWTGSSSRLSVSVVICAASSASSPRVNVQKAGSDKKLADPIPRINSEVNIATILGTNFLCRCRLFWVAFCCWGSGGKGTLVSELDGGGEDIRG